MMKLNKILSLLCISSLRKPLVSSTATIQSGIRMHRYVSATSDDSELKEFKDYLNNLKNYEKSGIPKGAGTDSEEGFDLGRMRRLMELLGNPQSKFKSVHIAGTKGKGSTAAFLSNILRTEGYSVGCYSSPHIQTIRERISVGRSGEPVSVKTLVSLFQRIKKVLDHAVQLEKGCLSHFEVFTAIAFSLFSQEKVDIAVIEAGLGGARDATNIITSSDLAAAIITTIGAEHLDALGGSLESIAIAKSGVIKHGCPVILGGPFLPHIERILRDKASTLSSTVLSACDTGNTSTIKGLSKLCDNPCQSCDIVIQIDKDFQVFIELFDVKLLMLGSHQLQNAVTATCASLCLRDQGWKVSNDSIRLGLEHTFLVGRSHFLTSKEVEVLGLHGSTILLDGAHTKESAKALADTIEMTFPEEKFVLVVAMASDKDHLGFARELLSARKLEAVFLTEVDIAGDKSRITSASVLKDFWIQASNEVGVDILDCTMEEFHNLSVPERRKIILASDNSLMISMNIANQILRESIGHPVGVIVVTGSLHIVSSVLGLIHRAHHDV